jgi:hypothetical protein
MSHPADRGERTVALVGCVKSKRAGVHAARDLYTSPLFRARVADVEARGLPWLVLSAKHGVLRPDDPVEKYDETLNAMAARERAAWGARVVSQLVAELGGLAGTTLEVHAGGRYVAAVAPLLEAKGARVVVPAAGLGIGQQLHLYGRRAPGHAMTSMRRAFEDSGLHAPPIPAALESRLVEQEPWCWTTRAISPMDMYMFREYPADALSGCAEDYVAVCHAGHGVNSYAISYHLLLGPLAVFVQVAWGGVYGSADEDAAEVRDRFAKVGRLIELAIDVDPDEMPSQPEVVVVESRFRGLSVHASAPGWFDTPEEADAWIREQPRSDDALEAAIARWGVGRTGGDE